MNDRRVDAEQLLERVAARARTEGDLPGTASQDQVDAAERELGFPLPGFLRGLYERVADGGFGPGRAVPIPGYNAALLFPLTRMVEAYREVVVPDPDSPYSAWPAGVVPMLSWGCFSEAAIDCLDPNAPVLRYEADVDAVAPTDAWRFEQPSVEEWWLAWVEGWLAEPTGVHRWPTARMSANPAAG